MAAPIQRYSDPRLHGTCFVKTCASSYEWIRTVAHPIHPECNLVAEVAVRALKVFTGALAIVITALPALIGRIIQIIHYHTLSSAIRARPPIVVINNLQLPDLESCAPTCETFHGAEDTAAIGILRWGFDPHRAASGSKIGDATYVSASNKVSASYGHTQLILNLDLKDGEIARLSPNALACTNWNLSDKKIMSDVRELFLHNGYRAIRYDLTFFGQTEAWAVYDTSCISISAIQVSPEPIAPASLCHSNMG